MKSQLERPEDRMNFIDVSRRWRDASKADTQH